MPIDTLVHLAPTLLPSVSIFHSYGDMNNWQNTVSEGREVAVSYTLHTLCSKLHDYQDRPP